MDVDEFIDHVDARLVAYGERLQKVSAPGERSPRRVIGEPVLAITGDDDDPVRVITNLDDDTPTDPGIPTVQTAVVRPVPSGGRRMTSPARAGRAPGYGAAVPAAAGPGADRTASCARTCRLAASPVGPSPLR